MPRKARIDAPGALRHIIIRGIEKKTIFRGALDRKHFLDRLGRILSESRIGQEYNQRKSRKGAFWEDPYHEIQDPRQRYSLIDYQRLIFLLQMKNIEELQEVCKKSVEERVTKGNQSRDSRDSKWTESIAVGSKQFIEVTLKRLGIKGPP